MDPNICKSNLYDVWAKDYDSYVKSLSYEGPTNLVNNVIPIIHSKNMNNLKILDFGCGTGLVGEKFKENINKDIQYEIDGIDISIEMLNKAKEKKIYNNLFKINIDHEDHSKKYDLILTSGVFLEGHAPIILINKLVNMLNKNGYLFLTIRQTYLDKNIEIFEKEILTNPKINKIITIEIKYLLNVKCKILFIKL